MTMNDARPLLHGTEVLHYPDGLEWTSRNNLLELFTLWLVVAGDGEFRYEHEVIALKPGSCLLMRRWETVEIDMRPTWDSRIVYAMFYYDSDTMRRLKSSPERLPNRHRALLDPSFMEGLLTRVVSRYLNHGAIDPGIPDLLNSAIRELDQVNPAETLTGLALDQFNAMMIAHVRIRDHPHTIDSIKQLASEFAYSLDHFIRLFKASVGITPGEALIRSRINIAKRMLRASNRSVSQIAGELKYHDAFAFSRQFKGRTGQSPTEYRNHVPRM